MDFARRVGIRRAEMRRLTGADFVLDESGHYAVRVVRGKGGKPQLQRVRDEDALFIQSYFTAVKPEERIFTQAELCNKLPYHYLRAKHAQAYYQALVAEFAADPSCRETVKAEIAARWERYHIHPRTGKPKTLPSGLLTGPYRLRGKNKALAKKNGMPLVYDRLAILATSVFALSHWRCDVTVGSYLLVK